jgi:aminoglycoside phosphotransferase (APT) family kinase protein
MPDWWGQDEARFGRAIQAAGLPVPWVGELLRVNGRQGLVLERLEGPSMLSVMGAQPWRIPALARTLADLQNAVHGVSAPEGVQTQRQWVRPGIETRDFLPDDLKARVLAILDGLPDGTALCHGDFHPGNVLMTARGPVIIDWMTCSQGDPLGDVARSSVLMSAGSVPPETPLPWLVNLLRRQAHATYLRRYQQVRPLDQARWSAWRAVMAANFLDVSQSEERPRLIAMVRAALEEAKRGASPPIS